MVFRLFVLCLLIPITASAANGDSCRITPPASVGSGSTIRDTADSCTDVCKFVGSPSGISGAMECGPIWIPNQNSSSTTFKIIAQSADCVYDDVDIIEWDSETAPSGEVLSSLGTLDKDSGCGTGGLSACTALHVPYGLTGYIYITSNGSTVGGAACASFIIRMKQTK